MLAVFSGDQAREHVGLGVARIAPAIFDHLAQIVFHFDDGAAGAFDLLRLEHRLERAEHQQRPFAQRVALAVRHAEQVADDFHRNGAGIVVDQVHVAPAFELVEQAADQGFEAGFHGVDVARRQRRRHQPAHPRVGRRVAEHQAGGVVLVDRRVAELGLEFLFLVGAEGGGIFVHRHQILIAGQEKRAVRHAMHRVQLAQGAIVGVRVGVKIRGQLAQVEAGDGFARRVGRKMLVLHLLLLDYSWVSCCSDGELRADFLSNPRLSIASIL